jgi:hypothetical protein
VDERALTAALRFAIETGYADLFGRALSEGFAKAAVSPSRDQLAAAALPAIIQGSEPVSDEDLPTLARVCAEQAYQFADAMLAERAKPAAPRTLAREQPCGCIVCTCKTEERCLGCGARHCGTHPVGEIPSPVYADGPAKGA